MNSWWLHYCVLIQNYMPFCLLILIWLQRSDLTACTSTSCWLKLFVMISGCKLTPKTCRRVQEFVLKVRAATRCCRATFPACGELQEHLMMSVHMWEEKIKPRKRTLYERGTSLGGHCEYEYILLLTMFFVLTVSRSFWMVLNVKFVHLLVFEKANPGFNILRYIVTQPFQYFPNIKFTFKYNQHLQQMWFFKSFNFQTQRAVCSEQIMYMIKLTLK